MKKRIILISIIAIGLILLISIGAFAEKHLDQDTLDLLEAAKKASDKDNRTVVAIVDGKEIYQETIDFLSKGEEISLKNSPEAVDGEKTEVDTEAILKKEIRNAVILSEAKRQGLTVSEKEAEEFTKKNHELVKEIGGDTYEMILDYMKAMELTEKEYLEVCTKNNQNKMTRSKLYQKFAEGKTGGSDEIAAQYEEYIDTLVEKADVEYVK